MSQEVKHLFRKKPERELVESLLHSLHFSGLNDTRLFYKDELMIDEFEEQMPLLEPYYLPCKAKLFLINLTNAKVITILRHLLRANGYKLRVYEKVHAGKKQIQYQFEREIWEDLSSSLLVAFT
jgi:hypothetical protein